MAKRPTTKAKEEPITIDAEVVPNDAAVTPTVTIVTPADASGRPLSTQTLLEMHTGREALKQHAGYIDPNADDFNGQKRGNPEPPRLQFVDVDNTKIPTFNTIATPYEPGQE